MLLDVRPAQADVLVPPWTSPPQKSNMGLDIWIRPAVRKTRINLRGNNAVQARHARFRWTSRGPPARPSGGYERGLHGHAGGIGRGARCDRREEGRRALRGA